jgi:hypothetical protein
MEKSKILIIKFKNEIKQNEIPLFRGAIIHSVENADILFHDHKEDGGLRYSYPLIQYKRINGCAAIVCLGDGTDAIGEFFSNCNFDIKIGERAIHLDVDDIKAYQMIMQIWEQNFTYYIRRWLPLNQKNYQEYAKIESLAEKCTFMERILTGNVLSFCKGTGLHLDSHLDVKILKLEEKHPLIYKGVKMQSYDAEFKTNISLPNFIGLGKGVSIGYGVAAKKIRIN